ncbi:MAG: signal peptide peptidase SppA [Cellulosilyticaceae bacterium]
MHSRKTGLWIALGSCLGGFFILIVLALVIAAFSNEYPSLYSGSSTSFPVSDDERIDVLPIEGEITASVDSFGASTYNHQAILDTLDTLIDDPKSKGLILFLNTPGGSIYETDEVYLKLLEYKSSGRPIYASMGSITASGGYYLASAADYIVCNRNTLTGSIGVIMPSYIDISEFLSKNGIKVYTPTAGSNKSMGNPLSPVTQEQLDIMASILDEAHQQFIQIVATGRNLDIATVAKLADGRIYSANQALNHHLVDTIGTLDDTIDFMRTDYDLESAELNRIALESPYSESDLFFKAAKLLGLTKSLKQSNELDTVLSLQGTINKFGYYYNGSLFSN